MSDWIIKVENLSKRYRIRHQQERQHYVTLRDVIADRLKRPFRSPGAALPATEEFLALKDVSFEIKRVRCWGSLAATAQENPPC